MSWLCWWTKKATRSRNVVGERVDEEPLGLELKPESLDGRVGERDVDLGEDAPSLAQITLGRKTAAMLPGLASAEHRRAVCGLLRGALAWCAVSLTACQGPPLCIPGKNCPLQPPTLTIAVGGAQACWIPADGTLWCWGDNGAGELARSARLDPGESLPLRIGSESHWQSVSAGAAHECAIKQDGTLWCWGDNTFFESAPLGNGQAATTPTQPLPGTAWAGVSCGDGFTCGIQVSGRLFCWGDNVQGQSGIGGESLQRPDEDIDKNVLWSVVAAGDFHACAVRRDGTLWCWGDDQRGQLGDSPATAIVYDEESENQHLNGLTQVGTSTNWITVAAGNSHSCGLQSDGTLSCWGANDRGQLGVTTPVISGPVVVPSPTPHQKWTTIAIGGSSTCATLSDATLWCWGDNRYGEVGLGDAPDGSRPSFVDSPTQVGTDNTWRVPAVGEQSACAAHIDGTAACWGFDGLGQVGDNDPQSKEAPLSLDSSGSVWTSVSGGFAGTCAVRADGPFGNPSSLWCTGYPAVNFPTFPYANTVSSSPVFSEVGMPADWASVRVGDSHACATTRSGRLFCWGTNFRGELGTGDKLGTNNPVAAYGGLSWLADADALATGSEATCALATNHTLWCWGDNSGGQLGIPGVDLEVFPTRVGADTWNQICGTASNFCGVRSDGTLWCWGGDQTTAAAQIGTDNDWVQAACGISFIAGLRKDGTVWATSNFRDAPTQLTMAPATVSISAGEDQLCGIGTDHRAWCEGGDDDGDLGVNTMFVVSGVTQVGTDSNWAVLAASTDSATFGIRTDGSLWGWGANETGQLGLVGDLKASPVALPKE
jgi:alpha-tubulin suppressor-like RCC1 family protein